MDEKIVYWVCGLGILIAALTSLVWVLVQKYKNSKRQSVSVKETQLVAVDYNHLMQMWKVVGELLHEIITPYNRLKVFSDAHTFTHEVRLTGRRRTDATGVLLVFVRVVVGSEGQPFYCFKSGEGTASTYPFYRFGAMKAVLEGILVNPGFSTDTRLGTERPVYAGPEAWTQADQDREDARLKSLV